MGRAAVACSGGVDSTFLLKTAHKVLGNNNIVAVFADTTLLPPDESRDIEELVKLIGCRLYTVNLDPLAWPELIANPVDRCYLCKKKIYTIFLEMLKEHDISVLMDGTNFDDLSDFRPGLKALEELGIKTPLADAGLGKAEIRQLSREEQLPNWNKPSSSCLATRIATDEIINRQKLAVIARCEEKLHSLGFWGCRVRLQEEVAVIELAEGDIERFSQEPNRRDFLHFINDFNMKKVYIDLKSRERVLP
jgi:uncharacterized protein